MLTVPQYDTPQVGYQTGPRAAYSAPDMPDVQGEQSRRLARAALASGGALAAIGEDMAKQANESRVLDAVNQAIKRRTDLHVQAIQLRGKNALERPGGKALPDEFTENLEKELTSIRDGLGNDVQKTEFTRQSAALLNQFRNSLASHMVSEQRQFDDDNDKSSIQVATDQASLLYGDASIRKQSSAVITSAVQSRAKRLGWDDKTIQAETQAAMSPMHVGIMQGLLKSGNASAARTYYDENSASMSLQARAQMQGVIKEASDLQTAEAEADRVWAELGPKTANDPVKIFNMEQALREKLKDNPDAMQRGVSALRQRASAFNAQQNESNAANINGVYALVDQGVPLAQIQRSDAWMALPEVKRHEIRKSLESEALVREQRAAARSSRALTDMQRAERMSLMQNGDAYLAYSAPSVLAGMTRTEVQALRPFFGLDATEQLLKKHESLQTAAGRTKASMDQQDFNHVADELGLKPYDPTKTEGQKRALGEMLFRIEHLIDEEQRARGNKELSRPEKMELMRREMAKTVAVPTWLGMSSKNVPVIQLTPDEAAKVVVPQAERAKISEALNEMNKRDPSNPLYAPTEENVRRLYLAKQSRASALIPAPK